MASRLNAGLSRTIKKTMRTRSTLLFPAFIAIMSGAAPVSAKYSEQWISNSDIVHARTSAAPHKDAGHAGKVQPSRAASLQADDDPIAAFARDPRSTTARR
jgi:hypothetical protein